MNHESGKKIEKEESKRKARGKQEESKRRANRERSFPPNSVHVGAHTLRVGTTFAFLKSTYELVHWHR
jgi:hypothetical protein